MASAANSLPTPDGGVFQTTAWTLVLSARPDSAQRRAALERLCRTYRPPVYGYLRRRGYSPQDADDLTQSFFLKVIEGTFLDRSDPDKGRFRGYLIGALRRHLAHEHIHAGAKKRGGDRVHVSWDAAETEQRLDEIGDSTRSPDVIYERSWAFALLGRAMERLEEEQISAGRARQFAAFKPHLNGAPDHGDYIAVGTALGISRTRVALHIHRLHRRFAELVRREVAETVADPAEVNAEMEHLRLALRS